MEALLPALSYVNWVTSFALLHCTLYSCSLVACSTSFMVFQYKLWFDALPLIPVLLLRYLHFYQPPLLCFNCSSNMEIWSHLLVYHDLDDVTSVNFWPLFVKLLVSCLVSWLINMLLHLILLPLLNIFMLCYVTFLMLDSPLFSLSLLNLQVLSLLMTLSLSLFYQ